MVSTKLGFTLNPARRTPANGARHSKRSCVLSSLAFISQRRLNADCGLHQRFSVAGGSLLKSQESCTQLKRSADCRKGRSAKRSRQPASDSRRACSHAQPQFSVALPVAYPTQLPERTRATARRNPRLWGPVTFPPLASPIAANRAAFHERCLRRHAWASLRANSRPSKGINNVESNSWLIDDHDWDCMLAPSHARQLANQRNRNFLCYVE